MAAMDMDTLCTNTIRVLAADCVQKAKSGHPGAPMGLAPAAHVLWGRHLTVNPANPDWPNRDRFVLSNGHGCALQYSMLHLTGFAVTMDDLKSFRQINSITPGHPENFVTDGVEVTTGPLGQGIAQAVGMAIGAKHAAATFNKPDFDLIDHKVIVFCGDGCLQEGVSGEASSLAGHLQLDNLIIVYDDNNITIDGHCDLSFSEDVPARYRSYGWNTITVGDGNLDFDSIDGALTVAKAHRGQPTLISLKTIIGYGSTKENTHGVHGAPLGSPCMEDYKEKMGFNPEESFVVSEDVYGYYTENCGNRGAAAEAAWNEKFAAYAEAYPGEAAEFERIFVRKELPENWKADIPEFTTESKNQATRNYGGLVINAIAKNLPELIGGSADLTPSNKTALKCSHDFQAATPDGRYLRFGVREHGMFAVGNGLSAYGYIPFTATFLNFITYGWGAVRLTALSHLQHVFVMTHDSIFLGEDGPTHQPVEVLPLLRATPNLLTMRPADGKEVAACWAYAVEGHRRGPSVLCLSRQTCVNLEGTSVEGCSMGAYRVLGDENADVILVATGSEVSLAVEAAGIMEGNVAVVSAPCLELFDQQTKEYRDSVLPANVPKVSIEASTTYGWKQYADFSIGVDTFGASAPLAQLREHFGFNAEAVKAKVEAFLA